MRLVLTDAALFPTEMLEEIISPYFDDPGCTERWFVCDDDADGVIGFAFVRPEPLTEGTWNLLAIGFRTASKGQGHGSRLLQAVESSLVGERLLLVETSGLEAFGATRAFYEKRGYTREAVIREYWAAGDDKVIYTKSLA